VQALTYTDGVSAHGERAPAFGGVDVVDGVFRRAIEALPSALLIVGADGTIVAANEALLRLFDHSSEAVVGQHVEMLVPEPFRSAHRTQLRRFLAQPMEASIGVSRPLFGRRRDGSPFPVEISLYPLPGTAGPLVLAVVAGAGERMKGEEATRQALKARADFEELVASVSNQFINVPANEVDGAIRAALQRIGESLDLDRCTFYRIQPDGMFVDPIGWAREPFPPAPVPLPGAARFPWSLATVRRRATIVFGSLDEIPDPIDREGYRAIGAQAAVCVPLLVRGELVGALGFAMMRGGRAWTPELIQRIESLVPTFANVLARRQSDDALAQALETVKQLSDQLQQENTYLRREAAERFGDDIVGDSAALRDAIDLVEQVAVTDSTVLLLGETGTGKELIATEIHRRSSRHARAMVRVNCSAIPSTLIESELFGRERGAYTGAMSRQIGRFELADQSTIFLDEIGELPPDVQVKLLRVLEERRIERLGSPKSVRINTRIIAATHDHLEQRVASGTFRQDLFYRLNVFPIRVPPLRERTGDIPLLVWRFVRDFEKAFGKRIEEIPDTTMDALQRYPWPGNIRELRNAVERAMIVATGRRLLIEVPALTVAAVKVSSRLVDVEATHIREVLEGTGWRIRGAGGAAERLGMKPTTLETRLAKLGIRRPHP
jgi:PAS domain S-box-containing protein